MCALVETAHMCFRVRAGIVSCTSPRLVVKYVPRVAIVGGTDRTFPGGPWDWHCEALRRWFQPSSEGAKPFWKHVMATVCICGPTCSWLECIYYIMGEVCPARSPVFGFSVSEKAPASTWNVLTQKHAGEMDGAVLVYACLNRLEDCVSTNPSTALLALAGDPAN